RDGLAGIDQGSVIWDGLDGKGRLVADGDYRLRLAKAAGGDIAEVLVHVDTNRSSLLRAINSEFELFNNLTCELDTVYAVNMLESEEQLVIEAGLNDIFALNASGSEARAIIPASWFGDTYPYDTQASKDGSVIAFSRFDPDQPWWLDGSAVWAADGDGGNLREVSSEIEDGWVLSDDGSRIYHRVFETAVYATDVASGAEQHLYDAYDDIEIEADSFKPQPGGSKLLLIDAAVEDTAPGVVLVDADDPGFEPVLLAFNWRNYRDPNLPRYAWSPDGSKILVTSYIDGKLSVFDSRGQLLDEFDSPAGPENAEFGDPAWSSNAAEVAISIRSFGREDESLGDSSGIYVLDLDENSIDKVAAIGFGGGGDFFDLSSYHVSTWDGSDWVERGVLHYRRFYREQQLDLSAYLPDADGEYKLRIRQVGKEAAHVESVALLSGGRRAIPSSAIKLEQSLVASLVDRFTDGPRGEDALASVSHNDYEVLDLFESEMQVEWQNLPHSGRVLLALNAREEALSKLNTLPFTYAGDDDGGFPYLLAANSPLEIDGELGPAEILDGPLFKQFSRPGTGHPSATVYGYVGSDSEYLYGALDFTVDNTIDGDLDWASMRVMTAQGWREYRVTMNDDRYGRVNFTRTPAVPFTHKYYEFRIPLAELDRKPGDTVAVSFQGYGTAALVVDDDEALPFEGRLLWPPGDRALLYDAYGEGKWAIDLDDGNRIRELFTDWPGGSQDIFDAFFTDSGRKLLFQSDRASNDPASICFDTGTDLWSYESLLNLVVDLRATRSNSAGGIILSGTVADLNFERYTLEYASRDAPDSWAPIFTGSTVAVVDARFTTWAPPAVDKYLLRLTAYDRAGNSRSVVRQASWGLSSAITDLSLAPEYVSPNGDGVQDEASLHYRVLEPVHLDFSIYNEQGDVVRTFTRDHAVIGTEHDLVWDGRNNQGLPVADGRYRVAVLGFEFFVNVDSTPPEILSLETRDARQTRIINREEFVVASPGLDWAIREASDYDIEIETGDGAQPDSWRPFAQPIVRDNRVETIAIDEDDMGLTLQQFVDRAFRLRVTDVAGNRTTLAVPPGAQQLILTGKIAEDFDALDENTYEVIETLAAPISTAIIEYRETGSSAWLEAEIDTADIAENGIGFSWLPAEAAFGKSFVMRVRATDVGARTFYSNEKRLSYQGVEFQYRNLFTSALTPSATLNGLDADG
ncbi:MAG TPA: FlgD immunoglobulin-like domain containing protein, partial [Gammaproteobacteria bacterium]